MYTTKSAWWDAKNRFGLPEMLPIDFGAVAHIYAANTAQTQAAPIQTPAQPQQTAPQNPVQEVVQKAQEQNIPTTAVPVSDSLEDFKSSEDLVNDPIAADVDIPGIPKKLSDLMNASNVKPKHIQEFSFHSGYFPQDMPIQEYPNDYHEYLAAQ